MTFDLRLSTFDSRLWTFDFRLWTFDFGLWTQHPLLRPHVVAGLPTAPLPATASALPFSKSNGRPQASMPKRLASIGHPDFPPKTRKGNPFPAARHRLRSSAACIIPPFRMPPRP